MAQRRVSRRRTALLLVVIGLIIAAGVAFGIWRLSGSAPAEVNLDDAVTPEADSAPNLKPAANALPASRPDQRSPITRSSGVEEMEGTSSIHVPTALPDAPNLTGTWTVASDYPSWLELSWWDNDFNRFTGRSEKLTAEINVHAASTLATFGGPLFAEFTDLTTPTDNSKRRVSDAHVGGNHSYADYLVTGLDFWLRGAFDTETGALDLSTQEQSPVRIHPLLINGQYPYGDFNWPEVRLTDEHTLIIAGGGVVGELDENSRDDCFSRRVSLLTLPTLPSTTPPTMCVQTEGILSFRIFLRRA